MEKIFVGVAEAAELCSVSRDIIYERFADGTLTQCKVGRKTLVAVDELYAWRETLKARAQPKEAPPPVARSEYWTHR